MDAIENSSYSNYHTPVGKCESVSSDSNEHCTTSELSVF